MRSPGLPVVVIPCDTFMRGPYPFHGVGAKYINAIAHAVGALPLLLPALGAGADLEPLDTLVDPERIVDAVDGLFFTGSASNVEPHHYDGAPSAPGTLHDRQRDSTTLPLLRLAIERGVPLLCVCRGMQELNVALGGTLHQKVQELPGMMDHRDDERAPREVQYAEVHDITIEPGGMLERLVGSSTQRVNSLHQQGVDRLAPGVRVEARASDGLVEAVSVRDSRAFALGVQWHPEWQFRASALSSALFAAFGTAVRMHRERRTT